MQPHSLLWRVRSTRLARGLSLGVLLLATPAHANKLRQDTLQSWSQNVEAVESEMGKRASGELPFLWADEIPNQAKRARSGELVVGGHDPRKVPHGLIHHWTGVTFIPGVEIEIVTAVLSQYDRYQDFYQPMVVHSSLVEKDADHDLATLSIAQRFLGVMAAAELENDVRLIHVDKDRCYMVSKSVRVREILNYGLPNQDMFPEGKGPGYVWQMLGITRLEQRDGGVYVEMDMVELSRGIPFGFTWLVEPLTEKLPLAIMATMLHDTKAAVLREAPSFRTSVQRSPNARSFRDDGYYR